MYKNGFVKVLAATPNIIVGDIMNNANKILNTLNNTKASIVVFPELSLTGYTLSDLFFQERTITQSLNALEYILKNNQHEGLSAIGMPLEINHVLFNVAVVIQKSKILGIVPKYFLPNNQEFSEKRWFVSGMNLDIEKIKIFNQEVPIGNIIFKEPSKNIGVGVEICQDLWSIKTPADDLAMAGANIILNLSASTELVNKDNLRRNAVLDHSRKQMAAYVYTTTGIYESSSEALFSSHKIIAALGKLINESDPISYNDDYLLADININEINYHRRQDSNYRDSVFKNEFKYKIVEFTLKETNKYHFSQPISKTPFIPENENELNKIYRILTASLIKKLSSLPANLRKIVIGFSGGLDSTHALIIAYNAFKEMNLPLKDLHVIIMPALASSKQSMEDAITISKKLGITPEIINIQDSVDLHLKDINHKEIDVTYENAQARIRTLILMNLANKYQGFVLGTGDLSEIALGFMTYNGDQMSMYAINSGLPKTLIQALTKYYAKNEYQFIEEELNRIVNKKISPELLKNQNTEDILGSYLINDFIMYYHLECGLDDNKLIWLIEEVFSLTTEEATTYVNRFINRFYNQQFKRTTMPEGPKVFNLSLSPRKSYIMPSDIIRK